MKTVDISGMSGPYENACQTMLRRFLKWSEEKTFDEVFPEVQRGKRGLDPEIERTFRKMVEDIGPSGAMWSFTLSHFFYIKEHGYQKWLEVGEERGRTIDWSEDGTIGFSSPKEAFEAGRRLGEKMKREDGERGLIT